MVRYLFLLMQAMLLAFVCAAQTRGDNWFAYHDAWFTFSSGQPVNQSGCPLHLGVSATVSDTSGALLLSANGNEFYNGAHQIVPSTNVFSFILGGNTTQPILIMPLPGDPQRFLVFGNRIFNSNNSYCGYFTIDIGMNGGMGGTLDTALTRIMDWPNPPSGKLTGVPHANGTDYWVLLHEGDTDAYYAFALTSQGLDPTPVISYTGPVHPWAHQAGVLSASYAGDLLVITSHSYGFPPVGDSTQVELSHFDDATGAVDFFCALPGYKNAQGADFSRLATKLYVTELFLSAGGVTLELWQYDLTSLDCTTINASRTLIHSMDSVNNQMISANQVLGLAPDKNIYYRHKYTQPYLGVVRSPEEPGALCLYDHYGFLTNNDTLRSLSNVLKRYQEDPLPLAVGGGSATGAGALQPMPFSSSAWLALPGRSGRVTLTWIDISGRRVREEIVEVSEQGCQIQRGGLPSGAYLLRVSGANEGYSVLRAVIH